MLLCERGDVETKNVPISRRSAKARDVRVVFRFNKVKVDPAIPRLVKASMNGSIYSGFRQQINLFPSAILGLRSATGR